MFQLSILVTFGSNIDSDCAKEINIPISVMKAIGTCYTWTLIFNCALIFLCRLIPSLIISTKRSIRL